MTPEGRHVETVSARAEGRVDSSASIDLVTPHPTASDATREVVPITQPVTEDPCASVTAKLEAERAARAAAEKEVHELRDVVNRLHKEVSLLSGELARRPVPEDTPYGAFLASPEAEAITDPKLRADIRAWLDEFPIFLRPGEATWIAEREAAEDWKLHGRTTESAVISFLGPERLAAELSVDKLFESLLWDNDFGTAVQAALPPAKRAEFSAKLKTILKESADPEEIEWILTTFPTFLD